MIVDTHALLWWMVEPSRLGPAAEESLARADRPDGGLVVSAASFWEIEMKVARGLVHLEVPLERWANELGRLPGVSVVPVAVPVFLRSARLEWNHRDPVDRILAAEALLRGVPVITRDGRFHAPDSPVRAVW